MALLTGGEGNHNFHVSDIYTLREYRHGLTDWRIHHIHYCPLQHAFPRDYRAGPHLFDWDPSKWIIELLHRYTGLITSVYLTNDEDINYAQAAVAQNDEGFMTGSNAFEDSLHYSEAESIPIWRSEHVIAHLRSHPHSKLIFVDGFVVDIAEYLPEHVSLRPLRSMM